MKINGQELIGLATVLGITFVIIVLIFAIRDYNIALTSSDRSAETAAFDKGLIECLMLHEGGALNSETVILTTRFICEGGFIETEGELP